MDSFNLSKIIDSISYVQLSTPDSLVLDEINKVVYEKGKYYISDYGNTLYRFDENGVFERSYGSVGAGPGEFIELVDFTVSSEKQQIIVSDDLKWVFYDVKTGEYIKELDCPTPAYKMKFSDKDYIILYASFNTDFKLQDNDVAYSTIVMNNNGEVVNKFLPYNPKIQSYIKFYGKLPQFFHFNGKVFVNQMLSNKIYTFEDNELSCKLKLDFGKNNVPDDISMNEVSMSTFIENKEAYAFLSELIETNSHYIFYSMFGDEPLISIYDKKTSKVNTFNPENFRNDIDNIRFTHFTNMYDNNNLMSIIYPIDIIPNKGDNKTINGKSIVKEKNGGNPILAIYYAK